MEQTTYKPKYCIKKQIFTSCLKHGLSANTVLKKDENMRHFLFGTMNAYCKLALVSPGLMHLHNGF